MKVSLTFTIEAEVYSQEEADYFLDSATNSPTVPVLADLVDCLDGIVFQQITAINGKSPEELRKDLQSTELR